MIDPTACLDSVSGLQVHVQYLIAKGCHSFVSMYSIELLSTDDLQFRYENGKVYYPQLPASMKQKCFPGSDVVANGRCEGECFQNRPRSVTMWILQYDMRGITGDILSKKTLILSAIAETGMSHDSWTFRSIVPSSPISNDIISDGNNNMNHQH